MIRHIILVGFGGGLGSIFRYLTSVMTERYYTGGFPLATFCINLTGCFLIGVLIGVWGQDIESNRNLRLLFITGFCSGYTTFSTFAFESITLLQSSNYLLLLLYISASVIVGIMSVYIGLTIAKQLL